MAEDEQLREYLRRAVRELHETRQRLRDLRAEQTEPIAIVGMACRFPGGVRSPEELWELIAAERTVVSEFPTDRGWRPASAHDEPGMQTVGRGGFLDGMADFDAGFFGVSEREAGAMDPQQRLLLEVSWEAIERARIDPTTLRGTDTGVWAAVSDMTYSEWSPDWDGFDSYYVLGNQASLATGRINYVLGLEGPAVTVDTACSGALVALLQAVEALRGGGCSLAVTGGVTAMPLPSPFVTFSRQRALAPDGRCKPYAQSADGTAWSEGIGMFVVERLSDARRNGHQVLAVIRGGAINSDGASNGLTAPNGQAQQRVIRQALANSELSAADVDVVEGHGTGTPLGDPIEAHALLAAYGRHRDPERPVWLGSVKSNIGHTQSAAGAAGLMKVVLAMRRAVVPATLHVDRPSGHIDWATGGVRVAVESRPWPETGRPRRAGVSAFGFSGTNAHVLVEYDPMGIYSGEVGPNSGTEGERASRQVEQLPLYPCVLSGRTAQALRDQAARLDTIGPDLVPATGVNGIQPTGGAGTLPAGGVGIHGTGGAGNQPSLDAPAATVGVADIGFSLATTRTVFDYRAVLLASDYQSLRASASAAAMGAVDGSVVVGTATPSRKLALLLPGQGSQRAGMGRQLYETFPVFRAAFDELCAAFGAHLDKPLRAVVFGADTEAVLDRTEYTQPALFAVEVAIYRLLESWGLAPDFLLGHSIGELAAAHIGGVFSLTDAAAVVATRGRLMQQLGPGAMLAVRATLDEVTESLAGYDGQLSVAASNGPNATVISGDPDAIAALAKQWRGRGRRTRRLRVERAFHSPHLDGVLDELAAVVAEAELRPSSIPLLSNVTGEPVVAAEICSPVYWVQQARRAVLFHDCMRYLIGAGVDTFIEIGPGDVLSGMSYESAGDGHCVSMPTLGNGELEPRGLLRAAAGAWVRGIAMDWAAVFAESGARPVDLPTYAFQHRRYWRGTQHYWCDGEVSAAPLHDGGSEPREPVVDGGSPNDAPDHSAELRAQLAALPEPEHAALVRAAVRSQIAAILVDRTDAGEIDDDTGVIAAGLTSLSVLELRNRLNAIAGTAIPIDAFLANPTPRALAALIHAELAGSESGGGEPVGVSRPVAALSGSELTGAIAASAGIGGSGLEPTPAGPMPRSAV
ncbi:type I polyketide synthase [Nocardia sp. GCM10030253]|uniref:type I polyketide synthase n=1 Tax=Nocardia sp. GCM10030253 TaxID=3273404 RepID=UPI00363D4097